MPSIGIFDSGVGGITVFRELVRVLPSSHFIYFGDTARCPYGNKSSAEITQYALQSAQILLEKNVDVLVVACHTVSVVALKTLQEKLPIPVVGLVEPTILRARSSTKNGRIGVIGTEATISSQVYQNGLKELDPSLSIFSQPCPLFATLVETGVQDENYILSITKNYLDSLKKEHIDTLLLACTHYPLLMPYIQQVMGSTVHIVDPALACAHMVSNRVQDGEDVYCPESQFQFFVSKNPKRFLDVYEKFCNIPISGVRVQSIDT